MDTNWCSNCDRAITFYSDSLYCSEECMLQDAHPIAGCDLNEYRSLFSTNIIERRTSWPDEESITLQQTSDLSTTINNDTTPPSLSSSLSSNASSIEQSNHSTILISSSSSSSSKQQQQKSSFVMPKFNLAQSL